MSKESLNKELVTIKDTTSSFTDYAFIDLKRLNYRNIYFDYKCKIITITVKLNK